MNKSKGALLEVRNIFVAFFVTLVILLVCFKIKNIWPMGDNSLLLWDMEIQYANIYNWFHDVLHGNANIFYDFSKSLGGDVYGIYTTYLCSPLNFMMYFIAESDLPFYLAAATLIKISLSSAACSFYIDKRFPALPSYYTLMFAISYGLCEYNIGLASNLHFLDSLYMLPILCLSVYYLIHRDNVLFCTLMIAGTLYINWYIGYMICLFVIVYYFLEIAVAKGLGFKKILGKTVKMAFCAQIGVLMCCVTLIPTILGTMSGKGEISSDYLTEGFQVPFYEPLKAYYIPAQTNSEYAIPAIFAGGLLIAVILLGLFSKMVALRNKIASLISMAVVFLAFSFTPLEVIWSSLKKTYSFFHRQSFVFCFLLVVAACLFMDEIVKSKKPVSVLNSVLAVLTGAGITAAGIFAFGYVEFGTGVVLQFLAFAAYILLIFLARTKKFNRYRYSAALLALIMLSVELGCNAAISFERYKIDTDGYQNYYTDVSQVINKIKKKDKSFYRLEKTFSEMDKRRGLKRPVASEGMGLNYNAISHYSSLTDDDLYDFLFKMGYMSGTNRTAMNYVGTNPFIDSLLGVKYLLTSGKTALLKVNETTKINTYKIPKGKENDPEEKKKAEESGDLIYVNYNEFAVPPVFPVKKIMTDMEWGKDPFHNQKIVMKSIKKKYTDIFVDQEVSSPEADKWEITASADGPMYGYFGDSNDSAVELYVNDELIQGYYDRFHRNIFYMGDFLKGDKVTVSMKKDNSDGNHPLTVKTIDRLNYKKYFLSLIENSVTPEVMKDGKVVFETRYQDAHPVMTTIPYDSGWTVKLDGEEVEPEKMFDVFIALEIPAGNHTVTMSYTPPLFTLGLILSLFGVIMLIVYCKIVKVIRKKTQKND